MVNRYRFLCLTLDLFTSQSSIVNRQFHNVPPPSNVTYGTRARPPCPYTGSMVKVMIVDHHALVRQALETRLQDVAGIEILGSTGEYERAPQQVRRLSPDVVLLEVKAPGGPATLKALHAAYPRIQVIVLTTYHDSREEDESLANGASRYLLKNLDTQNLGREIQCVASCAHGLTPPPPPHRP